MNERMNSLATVFSGWESWDLAPWLCKSSLIHLLRIPSSYRYV